MKKRFGGLLAIALGMVLMVSGLNTSGDGNVGVAPGTSCGTVFVGGLTPAGNCPVGQITITDATTVAGAPASWNVTVTSTCLDPATGTPVNLTLTVPTGGSQTSPNLYIFPQYLATAGSAKCSYTLTREANPGFTATFTPASPVTLPFTDDDTSPSQRVRQVTLVNQAVPVTTSASSTPSATSPATSTTTAAPSTSSTSPTEESGSSSAAASSDSQAAAPIAETGPSQPVTASLWLGIGLVLLGLFLCFEGRIRKLARHRR